MSLNDYDPRVDPEHSPTKRTVTHVKPEALEFQQMVEARAKESDINPDKLQPCGHRVLVKVTRYKKDGSLFLPQSATNRKQNAIHIHKISRTLIKQDLVDFKEGDRVSATVLLGPTGIHKEMKIVDKGDRDEVYIFMHYQEIEGVLE